MAHLQEMFFSKLWRKFCRSRPKLTDSIKIFGHKVIPFFRKPAYHVHFDGKFWSKILSQACLILQNLCHKKFQQIGSVSRKPINLHFDGLTVRQIVKNSDGLVEKLISISIFFYGQCSIRFFVITLIFCLNFCNLWQFAFFSIAYYNNRNTLRFNST